MIYVVALIFLCYFSCKYDCSEKIYKVGPSYTFLCILLILIAGLRFEIGGDTLNYYQSFLTTPKLQNLTSASFADYRFQRGYVFLVSLCHTISDNFVFLQLLEALFVNVVIFSFLKRNCVAPYLAVLVYFIINYLEFNTEILREGFAIGFGILAYSQYKNKHYIPSIIFFLLAYSMHISSLIILFFPIFDKIEYGKKGNWGVVVLSIVVPLIYMAIPNIEYYANFVFHQLDDASWNTDSFFNQNFNQSLNIKYYIAHLFSSLVLPMFVIIVNDKKGYNNNKVGFIYAYIILHLLAMFSYAFYRFANYVAVFWWISLAEFICSYFHNRKQTSSFLLLPVAICILLYLYQGKQLGYSDVSNAYMYERYIPYKTVLFDGKY